MNTMLRASYAYDGVTSREVFNGPGLPAGRSGVGSMSVSGGVCQRGSPAVWGADSTQISPSKGCILPHLAV